MRTLTFLTLMASTHAFAVTTEYTDKGAFLADAGAVDTAGFAGFSDGDVISTQYATLGFDFSDADDTVLNDPVFTVDAAGINGNGRINVELDTPTTIVGVDYPGAVAFNLYDASGALVYASSDFGGSGSGFFAGVITDTPFTRVEIYDHVDDQVFIDDFHVGGGGSTGPSLAVSGRCPGMGQVDISGLTPGGNFAVARASALGSFAIPSGSCAGTTLGLGAGIQLIGIYSADGSGDFSAMPTFSAGLCGDYVQVVDLSTCATTNVEQF